MDAAELKRRIPDVATVASQIYGIEFKNGTGRCPFKDRHNHGDRNPSLRYDAKKNRLFCASQGCFGENGVDAIGLVQSMDGCSFPDGIKKLADHFGLSSLKAARCPAQSKEAKASKERPTSASRLRQLLARDGYMPVAEYYYSPDLRNVRFEHRIELQAGKGRPTKTFRWEHCVNGQWLAGDGDLSKPLYVNAAFRERDQVGMVLGFEGEGKADLAGELGLAAFSFKHLADDQLAVLAGCDALLWPDNDDAGRAQMDSAAERIGQSHQCRTLKVLDPPGELPESGDIADGVKVLGWDRQKIEQIVETRSRTYTMPPDDDGTAGSLKVNGGASPAYFPFEVSGGFIWFVKDEGTGTRTPIRLASQVDVIAQTRSKAGDCWGRLLRWRDNECREHHWAMPMEALAGDQTGVRSRLLSDGLPFITTNARYRERFTEYLQTVPVQKLVRCVSRVGWHGDTYVLPDQAIGPGDDEEILYQSAQQASNLWKTRGTLDEWKTHVGVLCAGNSRLVIAVCLGFAGTILDLVGAESGGIHFFGASSIGKTTILMAGGSVCGGGGKIGFCQTWRTTINGLEAMAECHNDATIFLDELAQVDPKDAAETAYLLANGQGKARMTRSIAASRKLLWTVLFVSTGELTLAEHARTAGKQTKGGVEVRLLNIEADGGRSLGVFEDLHGIDTPEKFVQQLREGAAKYYGTALRAFLERLVAERTEVVTSIRQVRDALIVEWVPAGANGEVKRAAERFALIGAAGELATKWGITGWQKCEALQAAKRCFLEWLAKRGTTGSSDVESGFRQVRAFIEANGNSRFQPLKPEPAHESSADSIYRDRVGFRRTHAGTGDTEYLVFREAFQRELCKGYNHDAVLKELNRRGYLTRDGNSRTIKARLPGLGVLRVYAISAGIADADGSDHD